MAFTVSTFSDAADIRSRRAAAVLFLDATDDPIRPSEVPPNPGINGQDAAEQESAWPVYAQPNRWRSELSPPF